MDDAFNQLMSEILTITREVSAVTREDTDSLSVYNLASEANKSSSSSCSRKCSDSSSSTNASSLIIESSGGTCTKLPDDPVDLKIDEPAGEAKDCVSFFEFGKKLKQNCM